MWQYHPVLLFFQLGVLISVGVAAYCGWFIWRRGRSNVVLTVGLLAFFNAVWNGAATLKVASPGLDAKLLFYKLEFFGSAVNPSVAVALALAYLGYDRWLSRRLVALLVLIPLLFIVLIVGNPGDLMITAPRLVSHEGISALEHDFPPLFLTYLAWALGAAVFAGVFLVEKAFANRFLSRTTAWKPGFLLGVALLLPVGAVALKVVGVYPPGGEGINVTPAVNTVSLALVALAIGRYRLFELLPVGRQQALEVMQSGYVLVNGAGEIVDTNPAARTMLGGAAEARLAGREAEAAIPKYDALCESEDPVAASAGGQAIRAHSTPLTDGARVTGRVVVLQDITALREKEGQLEAENERLDQFARVISHDLQNPLNVAKGRLQLALEEPEAADDHLASVGRALDRMETIIDDILLLTWTESTIGADDLSEHELVQVARNAWAAVETAQATLQIEDGARGQSGLIRCNEGRLRRLFENLFRNAVEHGGSEVTVTVGTTDDGFFVEDDGVGLPQADREKVLQQGYSSKEEGTGLGLSIAEAAAEAHGWTFSIGDGRAGGARFDIGGVR